MRTKRKKKLGIKRVFHALSVVLGLVLIWRGLWYGLDGIDLFLGSSPVLSAFVSVGLGLLILYLPDKDLNEIEKL